MAAGQHAGPGVHRPWARSATVPDARGGGPIWLRRVAIVLWRVPGGGEARPSAARNVRGEQGGDRRAVRSSVPLTPGWWQALRYAAAGSRASCTSSWRRATTAAGAATTPVQPTGLHGTLSPCALLVRCAGAARRCQTECMRDRQAGPVATSVDAIERAAGVLERSQLGHLCLQAQDAPSALPATYVRRGRRDRRSSHRGGRRRQPTSWGTRRRRPHIRRFISSAGDRGTAKCKAGNATCRKVAGLAGRGGLRDVGRRCNDGGTRRTEVFSGGGIPYQSARRDAGADSRLDQAPATSPRSTWRSISVEGLTERSAVRGACASATRTMSGWGVGWYSIP